MIRWGYAVLGGIWFVFGVWHLLRLHGWPNPEAVVPALFFGGALTFSLLALAPKD